MTAAHVRRRKGFAFAAVGAAHAGLFLLLALGLRPAAPPLDRQVAVTPVYLVETRRRTPAPRPVRSLPRTLAVRPRPRLDLPPIPAAPAPRAVEPPTAPDSDAEQARLASTLRASRVGCANPTLLSERERARCEDRLAAGATAEKYIPTPLPAERRAYYDAVVRAKQPYHPAPMIPGKTPPPAAGASGSLAALQAKNESGIPLVGCKVGFGPKGLVVAKPPHSLKLGPLPCFISPPQGPLTVEANIWNPDSVVRKKD